MAGILPDAGFIYQRKVFIYYFLEFIYKHDLSECQLELTLKRETKLKRSYKYSIDFSILTNSGINHYFEVKDRKNLHLADELKPIFINFYETYKRNSNNVRFMLIHSWDEKNNLSNLYFESTKEETLKLLINSPDYKEEFTSLTFPYLMHNRKDQNLDLTELDLRSIGLIDLILKQVNVKRYGYANTIYTALNLFLENQVVNKADELKRILNTKIPKIPNKESINLKIDKLLLFENCFIDKLSNNHASRGETFDKFCSYFNIPKKIEEGGLIISQT